MTQLEFFTSVIGSIWEGMSTITVPFLNIPVTSLLIGVFVASFGIMILRPILGLGSAALSGISSTVRTAKSSARSSRASRVRASKSSGKGSVKS